MEHGRRQHGGLIWPVILIGAGLVFLLNNLGVLGWDVWSTLLRLWPVVLIAVGLDILIGRRSTLGSALIALLLVVVLGAAIIWGGPMLRAGAAGAVDRTEQVSADLKGAEKASVDISFGAGSLVLGALPEDSSKLIEGSVDLSKNERLNTDYQGSGENVRYRLDSDNNWTIGAQSINQTEDKVWDLKLNRDIPLVLTLDSGVGKSTLDFTNLKLTKLDINSGVGQVTVRLPVSGRYDVNVDGGVGELIVIIPEGLGARVQVDGGLGSVDVQGDFDRRDQEYTTPDFAAAEHRAEIQVNGGLGRVEVRRAAE